MVSNSVTLQLGYKEVLQLVQQLSDGDKVKLIKEIHPKIPQEKNANDTLAYLNKIAEKSKKEPKVSVHL